MQPRPDNFWPRPGPAATLPPDMEFVRHCPVCGYDLRALPAHHPCPECGSADGRTEFDPLPWERRRTTRAYLATLRMLVAEPDDVAMQVWSIAPLRLGPAARFRRINLSVAATCFIVVAVALTFEAMTRCGIAHPLRATLSCLPVQAASIVVGLNELTLARLQTFQQQGIPQADSPHLRALTYYLSAGLAFSPVHLLFLPISCWFLVTVGHPFQALAMHVLILYLQLLPLAPVDARLSEALLDLPRAGSWIGAALAPLAALISAGGYLFVGPVLAAILALYAVGQ